jgi:hypothetical protein
MSGYITSHVVQCCEMSCYVVPMRLQLWVFLQGLIVVAASVATASAPAATNPPPVSSAISVYVEQVPTASGSVPVGEINSRSSSVQLPPVIVRRIDRNGGDDAQALKSLGSSSAIGAPFPRHRMSRPTPAIRGATTNAASPTLPSVSMFDWRDVALFVALVVSALGVAALRSVRRVARRRIA